MKGMIIVDVPKTCGGCFAYNEEYDACVLLKDRKDVYGSTKPGWCPIKPVLENKREFEKSIVSGIIKTIEKEFENSCSSIQYECEDGTKIHTDVGYVEEWFEQYKEVLKKRYGIKG